MKYCRRWTNSHRRWWQSSPSFTGSTVIGQFAACMQALESHFCVAHVHGNNFDGCVSGTLVPVTLEVTLVNRLLLVEDPVRSRRSYPVQGLDMPNNRKRPDLPLAFDEPP